MRRPRRLRLAGGHGIQWHHLLVVGRRCAYPDRAVRRRNLQNALVHSGVCVSSRYIGWCESAPVRRSSILEVENMPEKVQVGREWLLDG